MRSFALALTLALAPALPAQQVELRYYYCFAPLPSELVILRGPVEAVGPVSERASYPRRFAEKLVAARLLKSVDEPVYCVMRGKAEEIERGRRDLVEYCPTTDDGTMSPLCRRKWTVKGVLAPEKP